MREGKKRDILCLPAAPRIISQMEEGGGGGGKEKKGGAAFRLLRIRLDEVEVEKEGGKKKGSFVFSTSRISDDERR